MNTCPLPSSDVEDLADTLDREQRAHEQTRQALVDANRELERLRPVELAARDVLGVCDSVTTSAQTEERLQQLGLRLDALRAALSGNATPPGLTPTIANLIMLEGMRAGAQGRGFDAYKAATLVGTWLLGKPGLPQPTLPPDEGSLYDDWLNEWTDGRVAERVAQLRFVTEPFFVVARDRLLRKCHEPLTDVACRELLRAYGLPVPTVPSAPPEAFTAQHAVEPEMPGLSGGEDGSRD